ncbi:MAG: choice-of-anchor V domain-containing protein, partial [Candidatus Krumholzibacteriia bacterium]
MNRSLVTTAAVLGLAALSAQALAFSSTAPDRLTDAPGEGNCTACHATFPLNSGAGSLAVSGVPAAYTPGAAYDVTITLADPDAQRWGFEFTVLGADTTSIGTLALVDAGVQLSTTLGRTYAKHTSTGTHPG